MATMPRTTAREPWDLAQAFIEQLQRSAAYDKQAARQLEIMPIEQAARQEMARFNNTLELDSYGKKLAIADPYEQAREGRQNTEYDRRQRVSTDENIRQSNEVGEASEKRIRGRYAEFPELLRRGSGRTATGKADNSYGGNVATFDDQASAEMFLGSDGINPDEWEIVGTEISPSTGKPKIVVKKKGFDYEGAKKAGPPRQAGTQPSVTSNGSVVPPADPPPAATETPPVTSGKGSRGAPPVGGEPRKIDSEEFNERFGSGKQSSLGFNPLKTIDDVPDRYRDLVQMAAEEHGVPEDLVAATMYQESRFKPTARSPVGAQGLMQIMPGTARELGVNPWSPSGAIEGGVRYLAQGLEQYNGNVGLALARYNAGPRGVERFLKTGRLPAETRNYVKSITGYSIYDWVNGDVPRAKFEDDNEQVEASNVDKDDPLFWVA